MSEENMGVTPEELDDLAWALIDAFPEIDVSPVHSPDYWKAKATGLLPVINKIRARARTEGVAHARRVETIAETGVDPGVVLTLEEALEKADDHPV